MKAESTIRRQIQELSRIWAEKYNSKKAKQRRIAEAAQTMANTLDWVMYKDEYAPIRQLELVK